MSKTKKDWKVNKDWDEQLAIVKKKGSGTEATVEKYWSHNFIYKKVLRHDYEWKNGKCRDVINFYWKRKDTREDLPEDEPRHKRRLIETVEVLEDWRPTCKRCGCVLWKKAPLELSKWCYPTTGGAHCRMCWDRKQNGKKEISFEKFFDLFKKQIV